MYALKVFDDARPALHRHDVFIPRPGPKEMQVLEGMDHFSLFKPLKKANPALYGALMVLRVELATGTEASWMMNVSEKNPSIGHCPV